MADPITPPLSAAAAVVAPSDDVFAGLTSKRRRVVPIVAAVVVVAGVIALAVWRLAPSDQGPRYTYGKVDQGDVEETIEATGSVQPLLQVQVGAQVSGRVGRVLVDFNAVVKEGELLAEIESAPFQAQMSRANAALAGAVAQLDKLKVDIGLAERNLERQRALAAQGLNAKVELDQAETAVQSQKAQLAVVQAQVDEAKAQVASARENLSFTQIKAPISGTVISRSIDPGQTVAASFQAPTLFVIANDLHKMQVNASIDEADVGKVKEGGPASVRVDAFPNETFAGVVRALRVQPTTQQGVVTYPAVVDVDNPDGKLRPGMTATVTLSTAKAEGVLRVPNAALRYTPVAVIAASASSAPSGAPGAGGNGNGGARRNGGGAGNGANNKRQKAQQVWVMKDGKPAALEVKAGLTDGRVTEVSGEGLSAGLEVIIDESGGADLPSAAQSGPGGSRSSGMRGPRLF